MPRLVFFGSDEIALPCLERIVSAHSGIVDLVAIYSQPDRPHGRGKKLQSNGVVEWAKARDLRVYQPERLDESMPDELRSLGCEIALVMAYGHILKRDLLAVPSFGFFNLHASLLPQFRGATPIEGAIASGTVQSGVSLQRVVPKLDAGPVVDAEMITLAPDETRLSLREKVAQACVPLIDRVLPRIVNDDAQGVPQDEAQVTFTRKITRADATLDFAAPAWEIAARVRALSPWPGVTFPWSDMILKVGEAVAEDDGLSGEPNTPGAILSAEADGLRIATGQGILCVKQLQRPAGKMLPISAFLAGLHLPPGSVIASHAMHPLVREGSPFPKPVS
ncbi:MAG: methionyl-tRNA formyltransferase [Puniceicoccales bacterium]|jgi:methionyl-tRNA formyltransferase|nr:methionyl-tRNA formyltransferase [Puniceicoccales bacterium]